MKFIGHLDTQRYFQKAIRRAGIPVAYSEGFSPHQKISFAQPLGVGVESDGEYFDMEVKDYEMASFSGKDIVKRLNDISADGICVTDCVKLPDNAKNAMASVFTADYIVNFREGYECPFDINKAIEEFNTSPKWLIEKITKKTSRSLDLKELVYELHIKGEGIFMRLNASSASSVKPVLLMEDLYKKKGAELSQFALLIKRLELYDINLNKLIEAGEEF